MTPELQLALAALVGVLIVLGVGWYTAETRVRTYKRDADRYRDLYLLERERRSDGEALIRELVDPARGRDVVRPSLSVVRSEER